MKIDNVKSFAKLIIKYRKSQGLTQSELASLCNVGTRFISDIENGKDTCQIGKAFSVAKILGIKLEDKGIINE